MLLWLGFAIATGLVDCADVPQASPPVSGNDWVILSPGAPAVNGTWTPSAEQVLAGRAAAKRHLERLASNIRPVGDGKWRLEEVHHILTQWGTYKLQAYGATENNKKVVRLSFLTTFPPDDGRWRTNELYLVCDGGAAFWQADFDPVTGIIVSWQANGVA